MYSELLQATRPTRTLQRADPQTFVEGGGTTQANRHRDTEPSRQDLEAWFNVWAAGGPVGALLDKRALMIFGVGSEWISDDDLTAPHPRTGEPVTPDEYLEFVWPTRRRDEWFIRTAQTCYWAGFAVWEPIPTQGGGLLPNREPFHGFEYVHPPTIDAFWDNAGQIQEWVQQVRSPRHARGKLRAELDAEDILHITLNPKGRHPLGLSMVDRAWDEIQTFRQNKESTAEALQRFAYLGGQVKVGREDGPAIDDNELRRVRQRYRRAEGAKWLVTGTDIDMKPFDSGTIGDGINSIRDRDIQDLATALDVPLEWTNYAGDGLGTGKPAESRLQSFESSGQSEQRRMAMHAVEWAKRLLAESPFPDEVHIDLRFEDILQDQKAVADAYRDYKVAYTVNEMREKFGDGPVPQEADIDGDAPLAEEDAGGGGGPFDGLMRGPDTGNPIRALQEVPDNAVSISDPSEAPEGASVIRGPRGGLYYVPGGGDGGEGAVDLPDGAGEPPTAEELATATVSPDNGIDPDTAQAATESNIAGVTEDDVLETGEFLDSSYSVVESFAFGGTWDAANNNISVDDGTWENLGDEGKKFTLAHEKAEMEAAGPLVDPEAGVSQADAVEMTHSEINKIVGEALSDDELEDAYRQTVDSLIAAGESEADAIESADYTFDGTGVQSENVELSAAKTPSRELEDGDLEPWEQAYDDIFEGVVWGDDAGRHLFSFDPEDVPQFAIENLREAVLAGALFEDIEAIPSSAREAVKATMLDSLEERHGWSVDSIRDNLMDTVPDLEKDRAEAIARTETASITNSAREIGYKKRFDTEKERFYWQGPENSRTTEACSWLKRQTNPQHGGEPVPLSRLKELIKEAPRHDDDMDDNMARPDDFVVHVNERHSWVRATGAV